MQIDDRSLVCQNDGVLHTHGFATESARMSRSSIGDIGCRLLSPQQQYRLQPHFPMQLTLLSTDKTRLVEPARLTASPVEHKPSQ